MVASSRFAAIASVFAVGTSAAAIHRRFDFQPNENAYWLAHDYKWGCSPGGCSANFNLVGKEGYASGAPGFDVVCSPIYVQRSWVECLTQDGQPLSETSKVYAVWQKGPDNELHYLNAAHVFYNENEGNWYDAQSATQIVPGQDIAFKFLVDTVVNAEGGIKPAASPTTVVEQVETPVAEVETVPETIPDDSSRPEPTAATVETPAPTDTQDPNGDSAATAEVSSESTTQSLPEPVPPAGENIPGLDTTSDPIPETQPLASTESTGSDGNTPADSNPADRPATTDEPAPDSQPTETPTPEAGPSPAAAALEAVSPDAKPSPAVEPTETAAPDAEPSPAAEPVETSAPKADPSPAAEPVETAAPVADPSPVVAPIVAAITPEADPSPVSKSEPEPEPTKTAAPETTKEPDATEAEEPIPTPTGDSEEVPPVDDSNFLVLAQPLAVPKTAESATPSIEVLAQPILQTKPTKTALPSVEVFAQPLRTGSPSIPKVPKGGDGA